LGLNTYLSCSYEPKTFELFHKREKNLLVAEHLITSLVEKYGKNYIVIYRLW
jgi:hypothetical protein